MTAYSSLIGRSALVTGGNRGLGRAMALGLLRAGAHVTIVCQGPGRPSDDALRLASDLGAGDRVAHAFGDVSNYDDCRRIVAEAVSVFGRVDVLINNAALRATPPGAPLWDVDPPSWLRESHVNCDSVFLMSRAVIRPMMERRFGKIVNVSTNRHTMARPHYTPYGPSKAFVEACSRTWAGELAGTGVTVNVLLPGKGVDTSADLTGGPEVKSSGPSATVMVEPALWLAADESNGHTGERFLATRWDMRLDLEARIAKARESEVDVPSIM